MITRVEGIRVGHTTDPVGMTGCTVVLCPQGTVGSAEVRGGAPGTRETDLLRPGMLVEEVNAVLLTGGSAFGLAAADGVMRYLEEQGIGFGTRVTPVPIVPGAVLFDLDVGDPHARPTAEDGYRACAAAGTEVAEGNAGAGTGATAARLHGPHRAIKGGLGTAAAEEGALVVGALAAVNSVGEILNPDGTILAGARPAPEGEPEAGGDPLGAEAKDHLRPPEDQGGLFEAGQGPQPLSNTTLVVVATNATLTRERAHLLAIASHEGLDEAIRPAHTIWDGDIVFSLATGRVDADQRTLERLAIAAVAEAIRRAVLLAEGIPGFPSAGEGRLS